MQIHHFTLDPATVRADGIRVLVLLQSQAAGHGVDMQVHDRSCLVTASLRVTFCSVDLPERRLRRRKGASEVHDH